MGIDKDTTIIGGVVLLTAFWIFMSKDPAQAASQINLVTGGLLGYLGASVQNGLPKLPAPPPNVATKVEVPKP